jgi:hypothetical protein
MKERTALAIASIINSAFETGLNPAWFEVDSLNKNGFLDAAFASGSSPMATPSGKPARADWSIKARLNGDEVDPSEDADTPWNVVTAQSTVRRLKAYVRKQDKAFPKTRILKYLFYITLLESELDTESCEDVLLSFNFDGVDDDCFAQIAIGKDVIYG